MTDLLTATLCSALCFLLLLAGAEPHYRARPVLYLRALRVAVSRRMAIRIEVAWVGAA